MMRQRERKESSGNNEGWKSVHAVMERRKIINATRIALMEAGFDDTRISEVISFKLGIKPSTVMIRIREQVRRGRMEPNPNNNKEKLAAKAEMRAAQAEMEARPVQEALMVEGLTTSLNDAKGAFEEAMRVAKEGMHRPGR